MQFVEKALGPLELTDVGLGIERYSADDEGVAPLYVLLTDTKTNFSKLSRFFTKDPYNHVSLTFDEDLSLIYTYALVQSNGIKGGVKLETPKDLTGALYSLYVTYVPVEAVEKLRVKVRELMDVEQLTRYNHLALINTVFKKDIFKSEDDQRMICSQFVVEMLRSVDVQVFKDRHASTIRPYELARSGLLKHVRRGKIK